ncbi:MAG: hypothetical protein WC058_04480 [Phycisphaeraceae bacterium]
MIRKCCITRIAAGLMMLASAGGCEEQVIRRDYRPVTGMPGGNYDYQPASPDPSQDGDWWDDLFSSDESDPPASGSQPGETRTFKPVWSQYGNPAATSGGGTDSSSK